MEPTWVKRALVRTPNMPFQPFPLYIKGAYSLHEIDQTIPSCISLTLHSLIVFTSIVTATLLSKAASTFFLFTLREFVPFAYHDSQKIPQSTEYLDSPYTNIILPLALY